MRRSGLSWLIALSCTLACNGGPITDWPGKHSENDDRGRPSNGGGSPVHGGTPSGAGPDGATGGGAAVGGTPGGIGGAGDPIAPGGTAGGSAGGGTTGGGGVNPPAGGAPSGSMGTTGGSASGGVGALGGVVGGTGGGTGILGGLFGGGPGGSAGGSVSDAGGAPFVDAGPSDAGAGEASADGAPADAWPGDGAQLAGDAGLCPTESRARADGGCQGSYCSLTLDALADFTLPGGACSGDAALRLACDAQLARKAAQCAQDNVLALTLESAVRSCLRRDPQLAEVGSACVDCYVEELMCTLSNCLATCVAGFDVACTSCRRENCGPAFTRCSGLPGL